MEHDPLEGPPDSELQHADSSGADSSRADSSGAESPAPVPEGSALSLSASRVPAPQGPASFHASAPRSTPPGATQPAARRGLAFVAVGAALVFGALAAGAVAGAVSAAMWLEARDQAAETPANSALVAELAAARSGLGQHMPREEELVVGAVRATRPAVVTIWNLQHVRQRFGPITLAPAATGSGVIFDERGYIATNHHVIANAKAIEVIFLDGRRVSARVVNSNPDVDIAILSVDPDIELPAVAPLADSSRLEPGMRVLAIGSPLGTDYQNTVTNGIIAGLNRRVRGRGFNWFSFSEFEFDLNAAPLIQTDAAINTGNSGGPLVNLDGEVVGLNTLIVRQNGGSEVEGLGFSVPSNVVGALAAEWIDGEVRGVPDFEFEFVTPELARRSGLARAGGVVVKTVPPGSVSRQAGLRVGDRITAIDGLELNLDRALADVLWGYRAGETVRLTVVRDGASRTLELTLQPPP